MKRFAVALLLLLLPTQAVSSVAVIRGDISAAGSTPAQDGQQKMSNENLNVVVRALLDRTTSGEGSGYVVFRSNRVTANECRTGRFFINRNKDGQFTRSFDAVIYVNSAKDSAVGSSLGGPTVPQLVIYNDTKLMASLTSVFSATACSTGVADDIACEGCSPGRIFYRVGTTKPFITAGSFNNAAVMDSRANAYGVRRLVGVGANPVEEASDARNYGWRDSTRFRAAPDTVVMWSVLNSHITGAKPVTYLYPDGSGAYNGDSLALSDFGGIPAEIDPSIILMGLARLDSLSGGAVFDRTKLPVRLGVTVDGAFMFRTNRAGPWLNKADSTVFKATMDSVAAINRDGGVPIKLTFGVNVDSLQVGGAYTPMLSWLRRAGPWVKFSPQAWTNITGTVAAINELGGGGTTSSQFPVDLFGHKRARLYVGAATAAMTGDDSDPDSSIANHLKWAKYLMRAAGIGPEEVSRTLLPPMDDWSPLRARRVDMDSMLLAVRTAGFTTIRTNGSLWYSGSRSMNGAVAESVSLGSVTVGTAGFTAKQGIYKDAAGGTVNVLAHAGNLLTGATKQVIRADSTGVPTGYVANPPHEVCRTWYGLFGIPMSNNGDYIQLYQAQGSMGSSYYTFAKDKLMLHSECLTPFYGTASIRNFTVADFSGNVSDPDGNPARNAWWTLKSVKNAFDAVNSFAGRTVIEFAYPEDIKP